MQSTIQQIIRQALQTLKADQYPSLPSDPPIVVERSDNEEHGDFACTIALTLAKQAKTNPRQLATMIVDHLPASTIIDRVEIAGPGFINFFVNEKAHHSVIKDILSCGDTYGCSEFGKGQSVLVEFVSANPTGPLHVGHGRGAAYGSVVANLLEAVGYAVHREYYVNDTGRQIDILTLSIWLRYLEHLDHDITFPENAYLGDYIERLAKQLYEREHEKFDTQATLPEPLIDAEETLDQYIDFAKRTLGDTRYQTVLNFGLNAVLDEIRDHLVEFNVVFDRWSSERDLIAGDLIERCIRELQGQGLTYERDQALWFRSTTLGDSKDRVIRRHNGQTTYFASDIAYHVEKYSRAYDKIINIWGADHHGYIARLKAALRALDKPTNVLEIMLVQFATLYRGDEKLKMSTRAGQFVTLKTLIDEVGKDAARFFYVMRSADQHLDFDLELAKSDSNKNPVYYVQYAHARICSVFRQLGERGLSHDEKHGNEMLHKLTAAPEKKLMKRLARFPDTVHAAATRYEPHQLTYYLRELSNDFHGYYNACQFIVDDEAVRNARLNLLIAVKHVIVGGLRLLGIAAPERM